MGRNKLWYPVSAALIAWLHCCYWYSDFSAFLTASEIMASPSVGLKSMHLVTQNFGKVEMSISRFLRRKSKPCSVGIIHNTMLFIFKIEVFSFSSISRDYISSQAPCQIFIDWSGWLGRPISRSLVSDIQIHLRYLMFHPGLLLLMFISLRIILIPLTYGHSGFTIKSFQCDNRYHLWITRQ
jgi:hypothetical protein